MHNGYLDLIYLHTLVYRTYCGVCAVCLAILFKSHIIPDIYIQPNHSPSSIRWKIDRYLMVLHFNAFIS